MTAPCGPQGTLRGRGYASRTSVVAGQSLALHLALTDDKSGHAVGVGAEHLSGRAVSNTAGPGEVSPRLCTLVLQRVGSAEAPVTVWQQRLLPAPPPPLRPWEGLHWPVSAEMATEAHWPSGLYGVCEPEGAHWLCVVVRAPTPRQRLLVAVDFVTPQAYCATGGKSLYGYNSEGGAASCVGFDRPDALPYPEFRLATWLEAQGIAADWCCSLDLGTDPTLLSTHDTLLVGGHFEYWSGPMREQLERFVRRGGRLIVLSGNTGYRRVRWDATRRQVHYGHRPDRDVCSDEDDLAVAFSEPPLSQPVNRLLGGGWWCGAYGGDPGDGTRSAYTCLLPGHWVFDGVWPAGEAGPLRTAPFMHYETDAVDAVVQPQGHALATGRDGAPLHTLVLAQADLRHWSRPGWATMSLTSVGCGRVFHAGTTDWLDALAAGDVQLSRITLNVLRRFLAEGVGALAELRTAGESIGPLPACGRLAAGPRRLYCHDAEGRLWCRDALPAALPWQAAGRLPMPAAALCHDGQRWWALEAGGVLWTSGHGDPAQADAWARLSDQGPRAVALCALPQCLYAVCGDGTLWRRPTRWDASLPWQAMPMRGLGGQARALALRDHHLLLCAQGSAAGLWRHDAGFIEDSTAWVPLHAWHGPSWLDLVQVDGLLYGVDARGVLRWQPQGLALGRAAGAAMTTMPNPLSLDCPC